MSIISILPVSRLVLSPKEASDKRGFSLKRNNVVLSPALPSSRLGFPPTQQHLCNGAYFRKNSQTVSCVASKAWPHQVYSDSELSSDPVGFFRDKSITSKAFAQFLRDRYKALKDLRNQIAEGDESLLVFASAYEAMGLHRSPFHGVELIEWAPAAYYSSVVGDFNNWEPSKEYTGEGYLGRDDNGCWRLFIEDKLRDGEEEDVLIAEYNYEQDYDLGDENPDWDKIFEEMDKEYWEPGEDEYMQDPYEKFLAFHREVFGPNPNPIYVDGDPPNEISDEESDYMPSARERYNAWRARQPSNEGQLPPMDVIDDGEDHATPTFMDDPVWRERVEKKKPPLNYWKYLRSGRKAWERKYSPTLPHGGRVRLFLQTPEGPLERVPAWASYVKPDPDSKTFSSIMWHPPPEERYVWESKKPKVPKALRIYECHVGISGQEPQVTSFGEFTSKVLPHIKQSGYNAIQLMGIQEHVDYASAGYKVTSFFAVSGRFGTPEDFKCLVDTAHGMGLIVIMDIVHSYAAAEEMSGLASFDGANDCFFYPGRRGRHKYSGTRIFNYSEYEVIRFLLSNLKWWVEEYQFDGFHFHSLQSMFFTHNGFAEFNGGFNDYCNQYVDRDALLYIILANEMLHKLDPNIITIAEDASLYPGLCEPIDKGGLGFDYHANITPSKMWSYLIENVSDSDWSVSQIVETLMDSQSGGKALVYAENHVQSMFERNPLAKALMTPGSSSQSEPDLKHRGVALHKIIKLITLSLGGAAYLNFMGNEFGHLEWVDFPRPQNEFSYHYARRRWELLSDGSLHSQLAEFDQALMRLDEKEGILVSKLPSFHVLDDPRQVVIFSRARLLFVFNFHPSACYENLKIGVQETGEYERLLDSDQLRFGGHGRLRDLPPAVISKVDLLEKTGISLSLQVPARSAQVYKLTRIWEASRSSDAFPD